MQQTNQHVDDKPKGNILQNENEEDEATPNTNTAPEKQENDDVKKQETVEDKSNVNSNEGSKNS